MSEKLKPNFTPIPNVLLDEVMRTMAPGATKVLFAICRFTYGWGKQSDRISLNQLQEITGMARGSVARSIKELGDVVTVRAGNPTLNQASEYRLNIEISDSDLVSLRDQRLVSKRDQPSLLPSLIKRPSKDNQRKKNKTGAKAPESFPIAKQRKHTRAGAAALAAFEAFYLAYPRHVGRADALKAWTKLAPDAETITAIMSGVARYAESVADTDPRYVKHPGAWLNGRRWEDQPLSDGNGASVPPAFKELPDGLLELTETGSRMSRRDYERRWGKTNSGGVHVGREASA